MDEQELIDVIASFATDKRPSSVVAIDKIEEKLGVTDQQLVNGLDALETKGYLHYRYANNQLKRIDLSKSFPK